MNNTKKSARQDPPVLSNKSSSTSNKLMQNYSKMLHNLISNSQIPHHKRTNSEQVNVYSKIQDRSVLEKSNINQSIQNHSSSRSPISSARQPHPQPMVHKDSGILSKKGSIGNLVMILGNDLASVSSNHPQQNPLNQFEKSLQLIVSSARPQSKGPTHGKSASIDMGSDVNLLDEDLLNNARRDFIPEKKSGSTPYFKVMAHRKSNSIAVNPNKLIQQHQHYYNVHQSNQSRNLEQKKNSTANIIQDITSMINDYNNQRNVVSSRPNSTQKASSQSLKQNPPPYQSSPSQNLKVSQRENLNRNASNSSKQILNKKNSQHEEEILRRIRDQLATNFTKIAARDKNSQTNTSSINNKSISIIHSAKNPPSKNVSELNLKRSNSPAQQKSPGKIASNPALQSIYRKVGKYINKPDLSAHEISRESKKISTHNMSVQGDKPPSRSASQEQALRKASNPAIPFIVAGENEKTIKPYLSHMFEAQKEVRSRANSPYKDLIQNVSRENSPKTRPLDKSIPNSYLQQAQKHSAKKLESNGGVKFIMDDSLRQEEKQLMRAKSPGLNKSNGHSKTPPPEAFNPHVGAHEAELRKSPAFFRKESPVSDNRRGHSPYELNRRRESQSPVFQEPKRGHSQPNIINVNNGVYLGRRPSPDDQRRYVIDDSRNSSNLNVSQHPSKSRIEEGNKQVLANHSNPHINPAPIPRPSHKKNSKSVSSVNALDVLIKGLNIPINTSKLNKENVITPNVSEPNSANASMTNLKINVSTQNVTAVNNTAISHSRNASGTNIDEEGNDDEILRERLVKLIYDSFNIKGVSPSTTLDYYRLVKMIGKGAFGKVYLGVHLLTGKEVAIKSIEKACMKDEASKRKVFQEVLILRKTHHKNVVRLLEVFENKRYLFMVLENASKGDLLNLVKKKGKLTEEEAKKIFIQIVAGIRYCHHNSILHRDVKLDNILLDEDYNVKICDFGVSRFVKKGQIINEQCGTPAYIAPEIIRDEGYEGCYADIWSMGVLLYAMVTGTVPFKASNLEELHDAIIAGEYSFPDFLSEDCKDLVWRMLKLNPYSRISIDDMSDHPWLRSARDEYEGGPEGEFNQNRSKPDQGDTVQIVEEVVRVIEEYGYPREYIIKSVNLNSCNHAAGCYYLLFKEYGGSEI